ncbi:MAG: porin [Armatimonadota bacterium]
MKRTLLLICIALVLMSVCAMAQPVDVPQDHWAYDAVSSLAEKGLVLGYPDGKFLGNRSVTRYEMATIIARVIEYVDSKPTAPAAAVSVPVPPVTAPTTEVAAPEVTKEDLETVSKLVDEFKTELTVIGADLKSFNERLETLEGKFESLHAAVTEPEGAIQANLNDVKKLKTIKVSGYVQGRYEYDQATAQVTAGDKNKNSFSARRARIKVAGSPTANTQVVVQIDAGGNDDAKSVVTKDAYLDYYFKGSPALGPTLTMGQFKWPFGYQVVQSSSVRETPERARVIRVLFPGERDRGLKFSTATENKWTLEAGLFNGTGANTLDVNNEKAFVGRFRYALADNLDMGLSWYTGKAGNTTLLQTDKNRYGVDLQYYMSNTSLKAEYVTADDLGFTKIGYWAQIAQTISKKNTLVVLYDFFKDPSNTKNGNLTTWETGIIHALDTSTKLKLFYEFNNEEKAEFKNDIFRFEVISLF